MRLWAEVLKSVAPRPGRTAPVVEDEPPTPPTAVASGPMMTAAGLTPPPQTPRPKAPRWEAEPIEPGRHRRISRERDPIDARLDLHGYGWFEAEDRLKRFVREAQARGYRAVLVITGKGSRGGGIIRDWAPTWLADSSLRDVVAGVSQAHGRHGGEGALYVALKRKVES
nr:Smr/MutS family protein [Caulobacter sp. 17J80-11]